MKKFVCSLSLIMVLSACSTTPKTYENLSKTAAEDREDRARCSSSGEYDSCMKQKGYKLVPKKDVGHVKGLKEVWVDPDIDFKAFEVIYLEDVDVSEVKVKNMQVPGNKVTPEEIDALGKQMFERFSKMLGSVMPVAYDKKEIEGRKAMTVSLKLKDIARTNIGINTALQAASTVSKIPIPISSQGSYSFECLISDLSTGEKLMTVSDEAKKDKNSSLAGLENFEKWKHAYNTMDFWADRLAGLIASKRGQAYQYKVKFKLVDF